jgi:hypothetical protein
MRGESGVGGAGTVLVVAEVLNTRSRSTRTWGTQHLNHEDVSAFEVPTPVAVTLLLMAVNSPSSAQCGEMCSRMH